MDLLHHQHARAIGDHPVGRPRLDHLIAPAQRRDPQRTGGIVVVIVAGLLIVQRLWLTALAIVASSVSGNIIVELVKLHVARPRPDIVVHLVTVTHMSFPSGHSANSAIVYLTLAGLASQVTQDRATRAYMLVVAILLVGAIGCSRVYLGVHWPSDVLAGWSFGTLWALAWWLATARVRSSIGGER